ncbi:TPA: ead/Ea22-like family protein [Citrobacter amalonaticus]|nr:ead/Ea22-like family protein [Citrobacter amalonaticus]
MTALNKQALREVANAANIASWGKWESYKPHKGARGYEVKVGAKAVAQHCLKVDSAFIAAANPATVLALLDELEAAEKRIAELEAREVNLLAACADDEYFIDGVFQALRYERDVERAIRAAGIGVKWE